jgi:hypothetical protein
MKVCSPSASPSPVAQPGLPVEPPDSLLLAPSSVATDVLASLGSSLVLLVLPSAVLAVVVVLALVVVVAEVLGPVVLVLPPLLVSLPPSELLSPPHAHSMIMIAPRVRSPMTRR